MDTSRSLPARWLAKLQKLVLNEYLVFFLCLLYFAAAALFVPSFATLWNLKTVLGYMLPILVASVGLTFVLITAGIDLSITSIIALASVIGGKIMSGEGGWLSQSPWAVPAGIAGMILAGAVLGALNGFNVAFLRIPAFMATLVLMMFGSGFAIWLTESRKIFDLPAGFTSIAGYLWLELILVITVIAAAHFVLRHTLYGRWLYAIGHNPTASRVSGVPVNPAIFFTYVISGLFAAFSAILLTASLETADPEMARRALLDIIGATVIGGTSLYGGKGKVLWTVFGVLLLALLDNSLNLLGLTFFFIIMIKGAVILLAATLDYLRHRTSADS